MTCLVTARKNQHEWKTCTPIKKNKYTTRMCYQSI